jgi:hypothetical protein
VNYEVIVSSRILNYEVMIVMNYVGMLYICYELCSDICFGFLHWYICTYQNVKTLNNVPGPTLSTGYSLEPVLKGDHLVPFIVPVLKGGYLVPVQALNQF